MTPTKKQLQKATKQLMKLILKHKDIFIRLGKYESKK